MVINSFMKEVPTIPTSPLICKFLFDRDLRHERVKATFSVIFP